MKNPHDSVISQFFVFTNFRSSRDVLRRNTSYVSY